MPFASAKAKLMNQHVYADFTCLDDSNLWQCKICTSPKQAQRRGLSAKAAMKHERGESHERRVRESKEHIESWKPQAELQTWHQMPDYYDLFERKGEHQMQHVDNLSEFIPFWQRQIAAADRGEELRLEAFLDSLSIAKAKNPWNRDWDAPVPAWAADSVEGNGPWDAGANDWVMEAAQVDGPSEARYEAKAETLGHDDSGDESSSDSSDRKDSPENDAFMFVEKVARMGSANGDRKRNLHDFYKCPTEVKIMKIQELILTLRRMGGH